MSDMIARQLRRTERRVAQTEVSERPIVFRSGIAAYNDGAQWLSAQEYSITLPFADYSASDSFANFVRVRTDFAIYVTRAALTTRVSTTNDASNYWTVAIDCYNLAFGAGTTVYSFTTAADGTSYTSHESSPNTAPTNHTHVDLSVQKTLAPGVLRVIWSLYYRLIIP